MKKLTWLLFLPVVAYAQEYIAEAPLSKVDSSGFYSIVLRPDIAALVGYDGRNTRIIDSQGAEVPYVMTIEAPQYNNVEWKSMKMEKELKRGCCTVVTLINEKKEYLDNFLLQVKNAEIHKSASLRGSDDGEIWYAVAEKFELRFGELKSELVSEVFDFPLSNYKYYRLTINDSSTSPLNIVGALRTQEDIIHGSLIEIPDVTIESHDSLQDRTTWGIIHFDTAQIIDRIEFDVEGPHLYKRHATLLKEVPYKFNNETRTELQEVHSFDIISGQAKPLFVGLKAKGLFIRVDNEDNPPLKFTQVAAYQWKRTLIVYLEKGRDYKVALGKDLQKPYYDLEYFKDSIPLHPSELEIGSLKEASVLKEAEKPATFFTDRNYIWAAIILVGIVLAASTIRILRDKEFNKKQ